MSTDENIVSIAGSRIFRYTDGENEWEAAQGEECIEEISDHIEKHIGSIATVYHEIVSDTVHIDIHHVKPTDARPFHTLITSGMSDLPMGVPAEADSTKYMELMFTLPADWRVTEESLKWSWPVRELKFLARFPHKFNTWLGRGHTIPNGDPAESFAENTLLNGVILLPSLNVPPKFNRLEVNEGKVIEFYSVLPLYEEEMNLKLRKGSSELLHRFYKHDISDIVDIKRKNVAKKRFGIF